MRNEEKLCFAFPTPVLTGSGSEGLISGRVLATPRRGRMYVVADGSVKGGRVECRMQNAECRMQNAEGARRFARARVT